MEEKFWLNFWKIAGVCFSVLVLSVSGCTMHQSYPIQEMVEHGADPMKARCAITGSGGTDTANCAVAVAR